MRRLHIQCASHDLNFILVMVHTLVWNLRNSEKKKTTIKICIYHLLAWMNFTSFLVSFSLTEIGNFTENSNFISWYLYCNSLAWFTNHKIVPLLSHQFVISSKIKILECEYSEIIVLSGWAPSFCCICSTGRTLVIKYVLRPQSSIGVGTRIEHT